MIDHAIPASKQLADQQRRALAAAYGVLIATARRRRQHEDTHDDANTGKPGRTESDSDPRPA